MDVCPSLSFSFQVARQFLPPSRWGHYLGMDVHDTPELSRSQPLQPGMVITIEPGGDHFYSKTINIACDCLF